MTAAAESLPQAIVRFWFGDALASVEAATARAKVWFKADPAFDAELARRFGACPDQARSGAFDHWAREPESALARILVLDQFPRNIFRGTRAAFEYDAAAAAAATAAVDTGLDAQLHPLMTAFVYLPFEHAEDAAAQARALELYAALARESGDGSWLEWARKHAVVIERFGRFPHRNAILGRVSTPEEIAFLREPGSRF